MLTVNPMLFTIAKRCRIENAKSTQLFLESSRIWTRKDIWLYQKSETVVMALINVPCSCPIKSLQGHLQKVSERERERASTSRGSDISLPIRSWTTFLNYSSVLWYFSFSPMCVKDWKTTEIWQWDADARMDPGSAGVPTTAWLGPRTLVLAKVSIMMFTSIGYFHVHNYYTEINREHKDIVWVTDWSRLSED